MNYTIQNADIELLRREGVSDDDIKHCVKVAEKTLPSSSAATTTNISLN